MRRTLIAVALASSLGFPSHLLDPLWTLLSSLDHSAPVTKAGCGADPNGRCNPAPTQPQSQVDIGCGMDPNGHSNCS
jgi:hypothetical protein